ncbi:MAG: undecaprenyldiphospho-muramoylpentapeptide beta-N-acetylglucosaminyltransferase [Microbacteriaceae bacterium]|nr:undecaprenyldiphospho-muramoylpentapeptide beta-N-acetylglucosaminyltransferase [Microbacteriaceae bacterium]
MTTYLLAGGGTAGHVNPLLALADEIRDNQPGDEVLILGTNEGLEGKLVPEKNFELLTIPKLPFPRKLNGYSLKFPFRFQSSVKKIKRILKERKVDVVVGFGGYAAAPAYMAAKKQLPIIVCEPNVLPGIANKIGAKWAKAVAVAYEGTELPNATFVGVPIRKEIFKDQVSKTVAAKEFGLDSKKPILLVFGGSLGAKTINDTVWQAAESILATGWQILQITGAKWDAPGTAAKGHHVTKYVSKMAYAYSAADLVLSRSGASSVAEITALAKAAVYVPLPIGNGEQELNAGWAVDHGAAILVKDEAFTPEWVETSLLKILQDSELIQQMRDAHRRATSAHNASGASNLLALVNQATSENHS